MVLREQGVPLKIVYLGHRDGTAMMVRKDSTILTVRDLKGKTVAVPNRFSNQFLVLYKALRDQGLTLNSIKLVEIAPPDMPAALYSRSVDAISSGEPFMGETELEGYGRVLYQAKDIWPNFISCVLVVHENAIRDRPDVIQRLVNGIAASGKWLEGGMDHRMMAADAVAQSYYNQNPKLLRFVLSTPPDRVRYDDLTLSKSDFEEIEKLALEVGMLKKPLAFEEYTDTRFSEQARGIQPYTWRPAK